METQANRRRSPAPEFRVGDSVQLKLKNIKTDRPSKKLDWKNAKYRVIEVIGSHAVRLNTPPGIHNVFHIDLIRPASTDPLPSQVKDDEQPPAIVVDNEEEWLIEQILDERERRRGLGLQKEYLVKWTGYAQPTWESSRNLEDTVALEDWLNRPTG